MNDNARRVTVYLNEDSYNCSMTTIHQLSRFLRLVSKRHFVDYDILSYGAIKNAMCSTRMHFFYDMPIAHGTDKNTKHSYHIHLFRKTHDELADMIDTTDTILSARC